MMWGGARAWFSLRLQVMALLGMLCCFVPAQGQLLEDLRSTYQSSQARLEAELRAFDVFEGTWQAALDSVDAAKARNDDGARDAAYLVAQSLAVIRGRRFELQSQITGTLAQDRDTLRSALLRDISEMETAYATASSQTQQDIDTLIASLEQEIRALDIAEASPRVARVGLITIHPIDRPEDIFLKAELVEARADRQDQSIQDIDDQLSALKRRLARQRTRRDVRIQRDRFDDVRVPVGGTAQSGTDGANSAVAAADSLGIRPPQSLEEEIREIESYRAYLVSYRDELRGLARSFRARAGGGP